MHAGKRLLVVLVLLSLLAGMALSYPHQSEAHWPYPTSEEVGTTYGDHVGEEAFLFGTVEAVDGGTLRVRVGYDGGSVVLTVRGAAVDVQPGGVVQVLGTLRPGGVVAAERVVVVNPAASSRVFKYATSAVGAVLVLVTFVRRWRIDPESLAVEPGDGWRSS